MYEVCKALWQDYEEVLECYDWPINMDESKDIAEWTCVFLCTWLSRILGFYTAWLRYLSYALLLLMDECIEYLAAFLGNYQLEAYSRLCYSMLFIW
jgi:hypothetical protein